MKKKIHVLKIFSRMNSNLSLYFVKKLRLGKALNGLEIDTKEMDHSLNGDFKYFNETLKHFACLKKLRLK